ncbi:MAG: right-handed parallel beta-helix repeat-containing protein [Fusobacteriaceae bacterium]
MAEFKRVRQRTTNSLRIKNGLAQVEPNELVITTDTKELFFKDECGSFINVGGKNDITINTIADLKLMNNLVVGDVVQVLGYYEKGDGSHHLRKISTIDDGSGELLANGLFANLIHDKKIDVKWFGAKNNKFEDSSDSIRKCLEYAKTNMVVVLINGKFLCLSSFDVTGIKITSENKKGGTNLIAFTSSRLGYLGWDYIMNVGNGTQITAEDVFKDGIFSESALFFPVSDGLTTTTQFEVSNIIVCGYYRSKGFNGMKTVDVVGRTYYAGPHQLNNLSVTGFDGDGIVLHSLEVTILDGLSASGNNGNGLFINNKRENDSPFEYVEFNNCFFSENRLNGVKANIFKKNVKFYNCNFNNAGQYTFGSSDGYDRTYLDKDIEMLNCGVYIADTQRGSNSNSFSIGENLIFDKCFCELTEKMLHLKSASNQRTYNNLAVTNTYMLGTYTPHSSSTIGFFDYGYGAGLTLRNNNTTTAKQFINKQRPNIVGILDVDISNYDTKLDINKTSLLSNKQALIDIKDCSFYVDINNTDVVRTTTTDVLKKIYGTTTTQEEKQPLQILFTVSNTWRTFNSDESTIDIYSFFKGVSGNFVIKKLTSNSNEVTCSTTGILTIKNNPYSVCSIQRLDNSSFLNSDRGGTVVMLNYLNTPYYFLKMKQEKIFEDFITYMDEKITYEKEIKEYNESKLIDYKIKLEQNALLTYEEYLATTVEMLPFIEPIIPVSIIEFATRYNLI